MVTITSSRWINLDRTLPTQNGTVIIKDRFFLLKGILLLVAAMLVGFVMAYELITTEGNFLGLDDVMHQPGISQMKQQKESFKKREKGNKVTPSFTQSSEYESTSPYLYTSSGSSSSYLSSVSSPTESSFSSSFSSSSSSSSSSFSSSVTPTSFKSSTESHSSTSATSQSSEVQSATLKPEKPLEPCFREPYQIQRSCPITPYINYTYGEDVSLEDISDLLFQPELLDKLRNKCVIGEWCINDDWNLVTDDDDFLDFCGVSQCLVENMPDDCLDERRKLVLSTLMMMCDAAMGNYTEACYIATRKMTHVTMSKLLQEGDNKQEECDFSFTSNNCSNTCHQFSKGLHCMCQICEHNTDLFKQYADWQWFFVADIAKQKCDIDNTTACYFLESPVENWYDNLWTKLKTGDVNDVTSGRILSGVIVAGLLMLTGIAVSIWACVKRGSVFRRYTRDRIEYTEVEKEEDDEYDSA